MNGFESICVRSSREASDMRNRIARRHALIARNVTLGTNTPAREALRALALAIIGDYPLVVTIHENHPHFAQIENALRIATQTRCVIVGARAIYASKHFGVVLIRIDALAV